MYISMCLSLIQVVKSEYFVWPFQACTDIENIDECIAILEQHDWNLEVRPQK